MRKEYPPLNAMERKVEYFSITGERMRKERIRKERLVDEIKRIATTREGYLGTMICT